MGSLIYLGIILVLSIVSIPFWLWEREREKERHARQLEAIRQENIRRQQDEAYFAWRMQMQNQAPHGAPPPHNPDGPHGPPPPRYP